MLRAWICWSYWSVFVRDHHRAVERVALAADSKLASLAPHLAEHFVQAEVKDFGFDELDAAVAWAGGPAGQNAASVQKRA